MTIQILPDELISQIAAGEVVERPASVVKELIENALDAEATEISIRIAGAGKTLIEVSDNGKGISHSEIKLAVQRHATSKLRSAKDLFQIKTLGFRGEALASMAAISRFTLTSCEPDSKTGGKIVVDGGRIQSFEQTGVPVGTVVSVEDLFYNVPARYAFLKKAATEKNHINNLVYRYALAYPDVRWALHQDQRPVLRTSGNGNRREILATMYGISTSKEMIEVNLDDGLRRVYGLISPNTITRSTRREMTFFVNGRWVQDAGLSAALYKAYASYLPPGRYPIAAVFLAVPPEEIDVNVHPAKAEVRFQFSQEIFSLVQRAVRRAFLSFTPVESDSSNGWRDRHNSSTSSVGISGISWDKRAWENERMIDPAWEIAGDIRKETSFSSVQYARQTAILPEGMGLLRLIGKMQQGYLLVEGPDGLYLIDEKAAQERILYESLLGQVEAGGIQTKELEESSVLPYKDDPDELQRTFQSLGIELEPFGAELIKITALPVLIHDSDREYVLSALLNDKMKETFSTGEEMTEYLLRRLAFHLGSVFNTGDDRERQNQLISALQTCQSPRQTPNGLATMIHLSLDFMNRQFGRD
jgi:DNA mismatch repair protein MutL